MNTEITTYTTDAGSQVTLSEEIIRNQLGVPAKTTTQEIRFFLELCKAQKLNPFVKDVYLIKYGDQAAQFVTSKEVFTRRAESTEDYDGSEQGITVLTNQGTIERREGSLTAPGEKLIGGWCRVYKKNRSKPYFNEVALSEYSTGKALWVSKPATMIRKVALVQSLREAFPDRFQQLYDASELGVMDAQVTQQQAYAPIEVEVQVQTPQAQTPVLYDRDYSELEQLTAILMAAQNLSKIQAYRKILNATCCPDPKTIDDNEYAEFIVEARNFVHGFTQQPVEQTQTEPQAEVVDGIPQSWGSDE